MSRKKNRGRHRQKHKPSPKAAPPNPALSPAPVPAVSKSFAEISSRVDAVLEAMREGRAGYDEIRQISEARGWEVSERTLRRYMAEARVIIQRGMDRVHTLEEIRARFNSLYEEALDRGELKLAGHFLREYGKVQGAYPRTGAVIETKPAAESGPSLEEMQAEDARIREEFKDWAPPTLSINEPREVS